jgi:hypothetical protein
MFVSSERACDRDERAEHAQTSGTEEAEFLPGHLTHDRRQLPGAGLIASDS